MILTNRGLRFRVIDVLLFKSKGTEHLQNWEVSHLLRFVLNGFNCIKLNICCY